MSSNAAPDAQETWWDRWGQMASAAMTWVLLLAVMMPLAVWFAGVKRRNRSWLIRMI